MGAMAPITQHVRLGAGRFFTLWGCAALLLLAGSAGAHTVAGNKRAARRDAHVLLGRLQLPSGAVQSATEPDGPGGLLNGPQSPLPGPSVDIHRWWRVPGSMAQVFAFLKSHPPPGATLAWTGTGADSGEVTQQFLGFVWHPVPGVLFARQLEVDVAQLADGEAGVRADAEVKWFVPRPVSERVPRAAGVLSVTRGAFPGWPPPLSVTIGDRTRVRSVAGLLDRLQIVQPDGVIACPAILAAPTITLTFRARAGGRPLARASMLASGPSGPCSPISFSVRGHREPPLLAEPSFLRKASRILGVALH